MAPAAVVASGDAAAENGRIMCATRRGANAPVPPTDIGIGSRGGATPTRGGVMEFLNLLLLFTAGVLILRKPDREALAIKLVITSIVLMIGIFLLATRGSFLPGLNY